MKRNWLNGVLYKKVVLQKAQRRATVIANTRKISHFFTRHTIQSKYQNYLSTTLLIDNIDTNFFF